MYIIVTSAAGRFGDALKKHEKLLRFGRRGDFFRPRPRLRATCVYDIYMFV